ncbi:sensor histidine kinase [Catenuloplanes atrovinosus]|uniref:histidine kinase n=1 Tax=Catenuloplanes atrovinosus TaxID=137266 RepID=A0AAE3YQ72_9ACTN|nr:histidine kinase [Catenuloplanes atrovinosus]MDR7276408.1 signal transduction histidine kinase [Catenuloplanes atrovinosus]
MSAALLVGLPPLAAIWPVLEGDVQGPVWLLACLVAGQSVALLRSRRSPLATLVIVALLETVLIVVDMELLVGVMAAVCGLGAWAGRRHQRIGLAFGAVLLAVLAAANLISGPRPGHVLPGAAALIAMFAGFWVVGRLNAHDFHRLGELRRYSRRLEEERAAVERRAAERERLLLARELHDILNHAVTAMVLDADATAETGDPAEWRAALERVAGTGRQSLAELRRLLGVLRTAPDLPGYHPLAVLPGLDDVDALVAVDREGGPRVRLERHGTVRPVDASVGQAVYRVVQESLTNVARHAGPVEVAVSLTYAAEALTVRVVNARATRPPSKAGGGLGLIGMRERVELVGGALSARPADGGFAVTATFPLRSPA